MASSAMVMKDHLMIEMMIPGMPSPCCTWSRKPSSPPASPVRGARFSSPTRLRSASMATRIARRRYSTRNRTTTRITSATTPAAASRPRATSDTKVSGRRLTMKPATSTTPVTIVNSRTQGGASAPSSRFDRARPPSEAAKKTKASGVTGRLTSVSTRNSAAPMRTPMPQGKTRPRVSPGVVREPSHSPRHQSSSVANRTSSVRLSSTLVTLPRTRLSSHRRAALVDGHRGVDHGQ